MDEKMDLFRYRYYYEDATALAMAGTPSIDTFNIIWWTEWSNGEHDVPPCYGSPCVDTITSNITGADLDGATSGLDTLLVHVEGPANLFHSNLLDFPPLLVWQNTAPW